MEVLKFLSNIGVDTRYISIYRQQIYINNVRFSRFSRSREEKFISRYPEWRVLRSKLFQKMCARASRILSKSLTPGEVIFINNGDYCSDKILYLILEPYTRKYGIKIDYIQEKESIKSFTFASSKTLDEESSNILDQLFNGDKLQITLSPEDIKIIYPLLYIADNWIEAWANDFGCCCKSFSYSKDSEEFLKFLEVYVPDVRENILKSAIYLSKY